VSWCIHAGTGWANAVAETNVAGTAATSGVLPVGRNAFDALSGDVAGSVDFGVVADVAGAWDDVRLLSTRIGNIHDNSSTAWST